MNGDYYWLACVVVFVSAIVLWPFLAYVEAPYGKRDRGGWGPTVPIRLSWMLLELPSLVVPVCILSASGITPGWPAIVLLVFWLGHYFHRSFIYPFTLRAKPGASFKLIMLALGAPMNALIGWMMATMALTEAHLQDTGWLHSPQFILGAALFVLGFGLYQGPKGAKYPVEPGR